MSKFAISGAQSTGKTTLLNALSGMEYNTQSEITRILARKGFKINEAGTDETQLAVLDAHLEREKIQEDIILDRCMLDGLVYTKYLFEKGQCSKQTLNKFLNNFEESISKYDIIFYLKPEFDIQDDGERSVNLSFRDRVSEIFDEYINEYNIPVVLLQGTVEERVNKILDVLNAYQMK